MGKAFNKASAQGISDVIRFSGHKFQDLTKLVIPKVGLFALGEFIDFLKSNLKAQKLEDLKLPLIITATDLDIVL